VHRRKRVNVAPERVLDHTRPPFQFRPASAPGNSSCRGLFLRAFAGSPLIIAIAAIRNPRLYRMDWAGGRAALNPGGMGSPRHCQSQKFGSADSAGPKFAECSFARCEIICWGPSLSARVERQSDTESLLARGALSPFKQSSNRASAFLLPRERL